MIVQLAELPFRATLVHDETATPFSVKLTVPVNVPVPGVSLTVAMYVTLAPGAGGAKVRSLVRSCFY